MKNIIRLFVIAIVTGLLFTGCDKADMKVKKLNHGDGTWTIESLHIEYYDSLGRNVVSDETQSNLGELIFFKSTTLDALFDYHLVVADIPDANGNIAAYRGEVYFDEDRADFDQTVDGDPFPFLGLWTVNDSSRHKQEWSSYVLKADGSLYSKSTLTLKKK
jgi:hypothetical protein